MYSNVHHRPSSTSPLPFAEGPLLSSSGGGLGRNGLQLKGVQLKPKQLQQLGAAFVALLLLVMGASYYRSANSLQRRSLSACSDRLAAAGLELSAASLRLPGQDPSDPSAASIYQRALERRSLYADLATETQRQGLLLGHEVVGSVTQSQVFDKVSKQPGHWKKPTVKAILKPMEHPVRSIVLPMHDSDAAVQVTTSIKRVLHNILSPDSVWWQDEHLMHAPLVHATVQESPAPNTHEQLVTEATAVATVAYSHCPIHAVLDRVVMTHTGVIMACWQVLPGSTEPAVLREALQASLPHAPPTQEQPVQFPAMLYTTVGRLLSPPRRPDAPGRPGMEWDMVFLQSALVEALDDASDDLCGLTTTFNELWYVQEKDFMALALNGHYTKQASHLKCHRTAPATATV